MNGPAAEPASADRVTVTRRIAAPAHAIFLLVCDPARQVDIDGSGMLRAAPGARPLTAVGQTFDIEMDRRPLGDVPNTEALHQLVRTVPDYLVPCSPHRGPRQGRVEVARREVGDRVAAGLAKQALLPRQSRTALGPGPGTACLASPGRGRCA